MLHTSCEKREIKINSLKTRVKEKCHVTCCVYGGNEYIETKYTYQIRFSFYFYAFTFVVYLLISPIVNHWNVT